MPGFEKAVVFLKGICLLVVGSKETLMTNIAGISRAVT